MANVEASSADGRVSQDDSALLLGEIAFHQDCILTGLSVNRAADVLAKLARCLRQHGYTRPGFYRALLARERAFPTGLVTTTVPVAIPHADPEYVKAAALAVAVLHRPVAFRQMDDPDRILAVRLVFLIALHRADSQIDFLRRFCLAVRQDEFLPGLLRARDGAEVRRALIETLAHVEDSQSCEAA